MSSTLGKWLESASLAAAGLAATANAKIAIVMSDINVAFFQFFNGMLCSLVLYSESKFQSRRAPVSGARREFQSCAGKNFVRRLESDARSEEHTSELQSLA